MNEEAVDCAAIIVTYNSAADIGGLLATLPAAADGLRLRVVVVDNDSTDDITGALAPYPDVVFVPAGANLGYAGGINVGRHRAGPARSVFILNPDLRLEPGSIRRLYEAVQDDRVGAAVPRLVGFPSLRHEPDLVRAFGDAVFGFRWRRRPARLSEFVFADAAYAEGRDVDWATGAAVFVAGGADAEVGPWSEDYFLYSEEVDYCRRLREAGYRIRYVPDAVADHRGGGSGSGPALTALGAVSRLRYYRRHHGRLAASLFRSVLVLQHLLRSHRAAERYALRTVLSERRWAQLPGGAR